MPTLENSTPVAAAQRRGGESVIRTVALVSLGCPKNLIDSEKMLGLLAQSGLVPTSEQAHADAIVINTCGFLEASKQEAIDEIQIAADFKKTGVCKRLVVAGCLVQRHRAKILDLCPQVDAMIGVFDRDRIVEAVTGAYGTKQTPDDLKIQVPIYSSIAASATVAKRRRGVSELGYFEEDVGRLRLTPRHYAYLRISEGCNQNCSFCTIPSIRGKMRSKPIQHIEAEVRELIADGAFEINFIGQDTTSYGVDIGYGAGLSGLLRAVDKTVTQQAGGAGGWIRLMYAYPSCFTDEMIDAVGQLDNVVKYIDMPLQHINDHLLARMRRDTSRKLIEALLDKLRRRIAGIAIRTTFITGFPGETEAQHRELVGFVKDFGFEAMGVFAYSPEPGTPAGAWSASGQSVPADVVQDRFEELMLTQQEIVFGQNEQLAQDGAQFDVLIDTVDGAGAEVGPPSTPSGQAWNYSTGRSSFQAPQIDGVTYVQSAEPLVPGQLVRCQVCAASGYDLVARPVVNVTGRLSLPVMSL